jgi:metallophosphoesterase (TIGR00282 family)
MNILAVGDIVGRTGIDKLKELLPKIIQENNIDFVIVNGENAADGMGLTEKIYKEILSAGANVVTMGNHTWAKKDIFNFIDDEQIIRPANYPDNNPGKGYKIYDCKNKKIAVINLIGRVTMNVLSENPFLKAKDIVDKIKDKVDLIFIDFHGEATAEKIAFGYYMDGEVTAIFGTHTHVQTADEMILPKGTGFISDIGMTGPKHSVIGMEISASVKRFETSLPEKYQVASGKGKLNSVMFTIKDETNKVTKITRINK